MRKLTTIFTAMTAALLLFSGCASAPAPVTTQRESDIVAVSFDYAKQEGYATNQFAVWIEDANGVLVKTLFATEFTANGGYEKRPDAIPLWVERAAIAGETKPDAASGATPSRRRRTRPSSSPTTSSRVRAWSASSAGRSSS